MNIYECCPKIQNDSFLLRMVKKADCDDLLKVYSDEKSVPLFNGDNCNGDTFFYQTRERMMQAIDFWLFSYQHQYFVRWSIIDRGINEAIGTVELFRREADDAFTDTALLRLDLRSGYEQADALHSILTILLENACDWFACASVTTKAAPCAAVRRAALRKLGFAESQHCLKGHDGTRYPHYFVFSRDE